MKENKKIDTDENGNILKQGDGQALGMQTDYYLHEDVMNEPPGLKCSFLYTRDGHVILNEKTKLTQAEFKKIASEKNKNTQY